MITNNPHHSRRWTILATVAIAQLMVVLDATIVNIALPSAQRALHFANTERQWIVTAYALAFGSLLLLGGRISDLLGRKWTFIAGLAGFATASAVGGAAQSSVMLAAARAFQGAFAALLAPAALSLMTTTFTDPGERNKAFGIWGAIAGSGGAIGLILGGVLTQTLSWRYSMYVNLDLRDDRNYWRAGAAAQPGSGGQAEVRHPGRADRVGRPVLARVRVLARPDDQLGRPHDDRVSDHRRAVAGGVRGDPDAQRQPAAAVAGRDQPQPWSVVFVDGYRRGGDPRGVPVPDLLPAAGSGLFARHRRRRLPADDGVRDPASAIIATNKLRARVGPRPLVVDRVLLGAGGMLYLTRLSVASSYATGILPALVMLGVGLGLVFSTSVNSAALGVQPGRRGRRVRDRLSLPADRWLARHRAALDDRHQRDHELHHGRSHAPDQVADRSRRRARRHHRVRLGRRDPRRRRGDRGRAVRAGHQGTHCPRKHRAGDRPLTRSGHRKRILEHGREAGVPRMRAGLEHRQQRRTPLRRRGAWQSGPRRHRAARQRRRAALAGTIWRRISTPLAAV